MKPNKRAEILVQSEMDYMTDRMTAMMEQADNPMGVELYRNGDAIAYYSREMPWPLFNHVKGNVLPDEVETLISYYEQRGRHAEFHVAPGVTDPRTLKVLAERGFYQSSFHVCMHGDMDELEALHVQNKQDDSLTTRLLEADEFTTYAEIHCLGTGLPLSGVSHVAENNKLLYKRGSWRYWLSHLEGNPAAVGVMFVKDGIASCTFAATLPEMRNRGLHTTLLHARIAQAKALGCSMIVAQCAYGSTSHRNMESVGLQIGMTRATWTKL
ncbi:GNAT family N-acetyltransferase [Paenibacillus sp. strain BS8-2]